MTSMAMHAQLSELQSGAQGGGERECPDGCDIQCSVAYEALRKQTQQRHKSQDPTLSLGVAKSGPCYS